MPFHDLNVPHHPDAATTSHTLAFLAELEYTVAAINIPIEGKLPPTPVQIDLSRITVPPKVALLTRLTFTISDPSQNHRLAQLQSHYNLVALRPTTEKALQLCCGSLECDLISLDLSQRLGFILKFKTVASALQRGIRFEICYSSGVVGGNDARRNLISGATALIRATRGRGIIVSSEARSALGLRGPWDVINLAQIWGLSQERGKEAVCEEARKVVQLAKLKRESFRGVIHVIDDGEKAAEEEVRKNAGAEKEVALLNGVKRKASNNSISGSKTLTTATTDERLSKREMKRRAKKTKMEGTDNTSTQNGSKTPHDRPTANRTLTQERKS